MSERSKKKSHPSHYITIALRDLTIVILQAAFFLNLFFVTLNRLQLVCPVARYYQSRSLPAPSFFIRFYIRASGQLTRYTREISRDPHSSVSFSFLFFPIHPFFLPLAPTHFRPYRNEWRFRPARLHFVLFRTFEAITLTCLYTYTSCSFCPFCQSSGFSFTDFNNE